MCADEGRRMTRVTVQSRREQELVDITVQVSAAIRGWDCSAIVVYCAHTTAGVLINEHADADVARDFLVALDAMVPDEPGMYQHAEGNSRAHVKASLVGTSQTILISDGKLVLGTWQGIFFAEFDGPRTRHVVVAAL